jgi:hypothetical protein
LTEGDQAFKDVGIRLKGHGSFRPVNEKPGLTVKFNRFNPDQKYRGLTKLQFNNTVHDPSYLREAVATQMFQEAGVPAPRVTHARLTLNGRDLGLYVVVEAANKVFLRRHFKDASGNLYEGFLQDVDGQPEQDSGTNTSRADLKALALAASEPHPERRLQAVGRFVDVDRFLTFVAMETLTARWDGYARNMANYRLYHDPRTDRMVFIPHGMVGAFTGTNVMALPPTRSLLGKTVFQTEPGRRAYRQRLRELFERIYRVEALTNRVHQEIARLSTNGLSEAEVAQLKQGGEVLCHRIQTIAKHLARDLATLEPQVPAFDGSGVARLSGWQFQSRLGEPKAEETAAGGNRSLHITASGRMTDAWWCTRVVLPPGKYRFIGRLRTQGVEPSDRRLAPGAGLYVTGDPPRMTTVGDSDWREESRDIEVKNGPLEVDLSCRLRGRAGEAWFETDALRILRQP